MPPCRGAWGWLPRLDAMSPWTRRQSTVPHALWLCGLLVVLGGLFGMHGLDNHGGAGMDSVAHAAMTSPAAHSAAGGHQAMPETVHGAAAVMVAVADATGHQGIDMGAAGMCMAVLVFSLIALILRLYASRGRALLWLVARPARAPGGRGRDPDPPSLICLSVQRC